LTPGQRSAVEEVRVRLTEGQDPSAIAGAVNRGCHEHVFPGRWDAAKIMNVALNPVLAGLRVWHGEVIGTGVWEPIITPEQHTLLAARFGDPARKRVRDGERVVHLLTGVLLCGVCDAPAVTFRQPNKTNPDQRAYRCPRGHVSCLKSRADALVVDAVLRRLEAPDAAELFRVEADLDAVAQAMAQAKQLRARLDAAADAVAEGTLPVALLQRMAATLTPKIEAAERRIREAGTSTAVAGLLGPQARQVWQRLTTPQRREVLRAVVAPRMLPASAGGRAPFDPNRIQLTWLSDLGPEPAPLPVAS
jgi:site-specific DNA recombinase